MSKIVAVRYAVASITVLTSMAAEPASTIGEGKIAHPPIAEIEALFAIDELGDNWADLIIQGLKSNDENSRIAALKAAGIHAGKLEQGAARVVLAACEEVLKKTPPKSAGIEYILAAATLQEIYFSQRVISPEQFVVEQGTYRVVVQQALRAAVVSPEIGETFPFLIEALKENLLLLDCLPDLELVLRKAQTSVKASLINVMAARINSVRSEFVRHEIVDWSAENRSLIVELQRGFEVASSTSEIRDALNALNNLLSKKR